MRLFQTFLVWLRTSPYNNHNPIARYARRLPGVNSELFTNLAGRQHTLTWSGIRLEVLSGHIRVSVPEFIHSWMNGLPSLGSHARRRKK